MQYDRALFETMPIPKAIAKNAIPAIISMMVVFIYNIADTFFIGQTGDELQVAAVTLSMPVFSLFIAAGVLLGIGGTSSISRALGEGREERAKKIASFCFYSSIIIGLVMMAVFWGFMPPILQMIGVSEATIGPTGDYLTYLAVGAPFIIISIAFSNIIRAEGKSALAMKGMLLGTIANIILDPILILGLDLGVTGAAIATVIGNILSTVYYVFYLVSGRSILSIRPSDFKLGDGILYGIMAIGIPASLNNLMLSVANVFLNNFLVQYGDIQLAAMGVAIRANLIMIFVQIGLGQGIQPLIGYSYGANDYKRLSGIIKYSLMIAVVIGTLLTLSYWFLTDQIIQTFIDNDEVVYYGARMLRALVISGPVVGIMFVYINVLQGIGKVVPSLILSISRHGLVFIPLLYILDATAGLDGIIFTQPFTDILTVIISALIYKRVSRGLAERRAMQ